MKTNHKTQLLQLLGKSSINETLSLLDRMLVHGRYYADLVAYKIRDREIEANYSKNLLSEAKYRRERDKFTNGLIAFINELDEREFLEQILLLSPSKSVHDHLADQFKRYFPNTAEEFDGKIQDKPFAFVVCNDFDTPSEQQAAFDELMQRYLDKGYLLLCATKLPKKLVSDNPKKVYAANSLFALFARVREMIDYVRYFR